MRKEIKLLIKVILNLVLTLLLLLFTISIWIVFFQTITQEYVTDREVMKTLVIGIPVTIGLIVDISIEIRDFRRIKKFIPTIIERIKDKLVIWKKKIKDEIFWRDAE